MNIMCESNLPGLFFFLQCMRYALNRMRSLSEFCVICDERHVLEVGLLKVHVHSTLESIANLDVKDVPVPICCRLQTFLVGIHFFMLKYFSLLAIYTCMHAGSPIW